MIHNNCAVRKLSAHLIAMVTKSLRAR